MAQLKELSTAGVMQTDEPVACTEAVTIGSWSGYRGATLNTLNPNVAEAGSATYGAWTAALKGGTKLVVMLTGYPSDATAVAIDPRNGLVYSTTSRTVYLRYLAHAPSYFNPQAANIPTPIVVAGIDVRANTLVETYASPAIAQGHQGYTYGGGYHYIIHTDAIHKYDEDWNLVLSNTTPLSGLTNLNHMGDGNYDNGKLVLAAENYNVGTGAWSNPAILEFNAATLERTGNWDISAQNFELSGVYSDADAGEIYAVTFTGNTSIWRYNRSTKAYIGKIDLDVAVASVQGIAKKDGLFWLMQDSTGRVYVADSTGATTLFCTISGRLPNFEGIEWVGDEFRMLHDEPTATPPRQVIYYKIAPGADSILKSDVRGRVTLGPQKIEMDSASLQAALDIANKSDSPVAGSAINIRLGSGKSLVAQILQGYGSNGYYLAVKIGSSETLRLESNKVKFNGITHWGRVTALPSSGASAGDMATLNSDGKTYFHDGSTWQACW